MEESVGDQEERFGMETARFCSTERREEWLFSRECTAEFTIMCSGQYLI